MTPYSRERQNDGAGRTTYYAVDTSVLHLFLNPSLNGPRPPKGGGGYGIVFDDDDDEIATLLGGAVSRYIFDHLTAAEQPLILLPGHDREVRNQYDRKMMEVDREDLDKAEKERADLAGRLHQLTKIADENARIKWLKGNAPKLFDYLFGDASRSAELRRFNDLLSRGRIERLASVTNRADFFDSDVDVALRIRKIFNFVPSLSDESGYYIRWVDLLKTWKNKEKRPGAVDYDASALARLELINRHLDREGRRLVLITGDDSMLAAAGEYRPYVDRRQDFATLYLRHPRAFLAAPEVLLPGEADSTGERKKPKLLDDWLDTFLAEYTDERGVSEELIREIALGYPERLTALHKRASDVTKAVPNAAENIKAQWSEHTSALRKAHTATSAVVRAEILRILGPTSDQTTEEVLSSLNRRFDEEKLNTWDGVFKAVMAAGYDLLAPDELVSIKPWRNPPGISFGSFVKTREFVRRAISSRPLDAIDPKKFAAFLQSLDDDAGTDYARALVYAVLFARANRWHVALCVARRAMNIADRIQCRVAKEMAGGAPVPLALREISGREAFYFCATAERLLARRREDLDSAAALLDKAENALRRDRSLHQKPRPSDLRFKAERVMLKFSYYLFDRFASPTRVDPSERTYLYGLFDELMGLVDELEGEADEWIRIYVERVLLNHIFSLASVMEHDDNLDDFHFAACRSRVQQFLQSVGSQQTREGYDIPVTRLARALADYALAKFGEPDRSDRERIAERLQLLKLDLQKDQESLKLSRYDPERFRYLSDFTERALVRRDEAREQSDKWRGTPA